MRNKVFKSLESKDLDVIDSALKDFELEMNKQNNPSESDKVLIDKVKRQVQKAKTRKGIPYSQICYIRNQFN